ncbi:MAG: carboxypeptidase regulatory-like domain-containing protein, partial [Acidimicrobiia bacterium]|nr:carboxypeptidase regulatory-like domain-containing protein [Acidimicrobiia bacterium]
TQVLYARAADVPDRSRRFLPSIRAWAAGADAIYDDSAAETGGRRRIRFVHDAECALDVDAVELHPGADDDFDATVAALRAAGYDRRDRVYLAFVDATAYCGIASVEGDDHPDPTNANNDGPAFARVDAGCWNAATVAHEHVHALGGVQDSAPNATRSGHCTDEWDLLCYSDEPDRPAMRVVCADAARNVSRLDCGHDDYFSTAPPAASYLATHWNIADSAFLVEPGPTGSLRGHLRDAAGGRIAGGRVWLAGTTVPPALSDAEGAFAFEAVSFGRYRLRADDGCVEGARSVRVDGDEERGITLRTARRDAADHVCTRVDAVPLDASDALDLSGDDESAALELPFAFPFYGTSARTVRVSTNGSINVNGEETPFDNSAVPDPEAPNGAVYAFWDDLAVDASSSMRTGVSGRAPDRKVVVEWRNVAPIAGRDQRLTVQAVLGEDGSVVLSYRDVGEGELERGGSATIGLEGPRGGIGFGFSVDTPMVRDGLSVRFEQAGGTPPTAVAEGPVSVASGQAFRVDARRSSDPEGEPMVFAWRQLDGPPVGLEDRDSPVLDVPGSTGPATLTFRVRATDASGLTDADTVTVRVEPPG